MVAIDILRKHQEKGISQMRQLRSGSLAGDTTHAIEQIDRSPADIERLVLEVSLEALVERVCAAIEANAWLQSRAKAIDMLLKSVVIPWIECNGEFSIGPYRYAVDYPTVVKCLNVVQTGHAVLEAAHGDFDVVLKSLASQPYKYGTVRSVVGLTRYSQLFDTKRSSRLINGVPDRDLKRTDTRFLR